MALWSHIYGYGLISTVMVSYLRLWYHIYGWRYGIISTVMVSYLRLWYHIYGYGLISTVMVSYLRLWYHIYGWRYGIISTVPYEQQKIYRQIILFQRIYYLSISLTGLPCHREPSIVLMSMPQLQALTRLLTLMFQVCLMSSHHSWYGGPHWATRARNSFSSFPTELDPSVQTPPEASHSWAATTV